MGIASVMNQNPIIVSFIAIKATILRVCIQSQIRHHKLDNTVLGVLHIRNVILHLNW